MLQRQFDEFETMACFAPIKARTSGASLNPSHSQKCPSALVAPARKTALSSSNMLVRPIGKIFRQMSNSPWKPRVHVSAIVRGVGRVH